MTGSKFLCANIYVCQMAANFDLAEPVNKPDVKCTCRLCGSRDTVLEMEARDLVSACPVCRRMRNDNAGADNVLAKCLQVKGQYCAYCNCEYSESETDAEAKENDMAAKILKIFLGCREMSAMREDLRKLIWEQKAGQGTEVGCSELCKAICAVLNRMEDNEKKRNLRRKILEVIRPMQLLKEHCKNGCLEDTPNMVR